MQALFNRQALRKLKTIALVLSVLTFLIGVPFASNIYADSTSDQKIEDFFSSPLTSENYLNTLYLYPYLYCLYYYPKEALNANDVADLNFFNNSPTKGVGYIVDPPETGGDGKMSCGEEVASWPPIRGAVTKIGVTPEQFASYFYNKSSSGLSYTLKSNADDKIKGLVQSELMNINYELEQVQLVTAFSGCYKEAEGGPLEKAGKKYDYLNNKDKDTKTPVGWWLDGTDNDGYMGCKDIYNAVSDSTLLNLYDLGYSTASLRDKSATYLYALAANKNIEEAEQTALDELIRLFTNSPQRMQDCAAVVLPAGSLSSDLATAASSTASVMLEPDKYTISSNTSDEQEKAFRSCLVADDSPYKAAISLIMDAFAISTNTATNWRDELNSINTASDNEGNSQSDDCLSNDSFIGWVVCPFLNLVDSVLESLEDVIQGMLRFSLEDTTVEVNGKSIQVYGQNQNDELKASWNIFRSIATILLIIGFLIALLAKAIKG